MQSSLTTPIPRSRIPTTPARTSFVAALFAKEYNSSCPALTEASEDGYQVCNVLNRSYSENQRLGCRAVSVGIGNLWTLEDALAKAGCTVYAYDPTVDLHARHEAHARARHGIHFFFAGLGVSPEAKTTNNALKIIQKSHLSGYGTLNMSTFRPLDELVHRAQRGREGGELDLLKIDCEGCEWDTFEDLATRAPHALARVKQVIIELHLRNGFGDPAANVRNSSADAEDRCQAGQTAGLLNPCFSGYAQDTGFGLRAPQQFDTLMSHLLVEHGFRVAFARAHRGKGRSIRFNRAAPGMTEAGFPSFLCCVELTLIRTAGAFVT